MFLDAMTEKMRPKEISKFHRLIIEFYKAMFCVVNAHRSLIFPEQILLSGCCMTTMIWGVRNIEMS